MVNGGTVVLSKRWRDVISDKRWSDVISDKRWSDVISNKRKCIRFFNLSQAATAFRIVVNHSTEARLPHRGTVDTVTRPVSNGSTHGFYYRKISDRMTPKICII